MAATITPHQLEIYRRSARERLVKKEREGALLRERAWSAARAAAELLKENFGATRVIAFGSLAHQAWFGPGSDIDLAAYGIAPASFWQAWCGLDQLESGFEFDLIAGETTAGSLLDEITHDGVEL